MQIKATISWIANDVLGTIIGILFIFHLIFTALCQESKSIPILQMKILGQEGLNKLAKVT